LGRGFRYCGASTSQKAKNVSDVKTTTQARYIKFLAKHGEFENFKLNHIIYCHVLYILQTLNFVGVPSGLGHKRIPLFENKKVDTIGHMKEASLLFLCEMTF
jgi:hypothetical protein